MKRRKRGALKGSRRVGRLLKRLPDTINGEIVEVFRQSAPVITAYAQAAPAPRKTGTLSRAIRAKVYEKTLKLRVGLFGKKLNQDLFYAKILEEGRGFKRPFAVVRRRLKGGGKSVYRMRISQISAGRFDFLSGRAMGFAIDTVRPGLANVWERALRKAAGVGDD